jgi:hypothetical protein
MNFERLGLTPQQQTEIDAKFLFITIDMLNQCDHYRDMAWRMAESALPPLLEKVCVRTYDQAHGMVMGGEKIDSTTIQVLGGLSFVNALWLPSSEKATRKSPDEERGRGDWHQNRRLFAGLPNCDIF